MTAFAIWVMFAIYMYATGHPIAGTVGLLMGFIAGWANR